MAVTLHQSATSPNMTNNTLVYNVLSNKITQPQFQYVCDVKTSGGALIQRLKQQPNPSGYGVFDVGMILNYQLGPIDKVWKQAGNEPVGNTNGGADFDIFFGEEYGANVSSSVTLYSGIGNDVGNPAVSGSEYLFGIDGLVDPNDKQNWNWPSQSKYDEELTDDITFTHQNALTNFNTGSVRLGDYATLSFIQGNADGGFPKTGSAQDVYAMHVEQYDANNTKVSESYSWNFDYPARTVFSPDGSSSTWSTVYTSQSAATRLIHWGVGPENLSDGSIPLTSSCAYYTVTFMAQATDSYENVDGIWGVYRYDVVDKNCGYDGVRFAWKNEYGVWDYFNFGLAESTTSEITRHEYTQTFLPFSNNGTTVPYDTERRGRTNYINLVNRRRTAESDYLTQSEADNLNEMFYSADVYVQDGSDFYPIKITNASVTEKVNPRSQKLFTLRVEYQYANDMRNRL